MNVTSSFQAYSPLLILFGFALTVALAMLVGDALLGRRKPNPVKSSPFECGMPPRSEVRPRIHVRYFIVALLFLLFDTEIVFIYLWSCLLRSLGWAGFWEMGAFLLVLGLGLAFAWKKGALEWE